MVNTILCPLSGAEHARPVLDTAFSLAAKLSAHLEVLHVRPDSKDTVPLLGEGMSVAMVEDMIELADKEGAERAARARSMFDDAVKRHGSEVAERPVPRPTATCAFVEESGREDEVVARRGRLNDLVVVARPTAESDVTSTLTLNAAVFETGRPVFVVPPGGAKLEAERIAISWNGSAQSAKAVSSAVKLLEKASHVVVLTVDSPITSAARAHELATYLEWHGVKPETHTFEAGPKSVGERLLQEVKAADADLLVMGAYTHSRMRQLILGGVTRHVLENADIPLLMAH